MGSARKIRSSIRFKSLSTTGTKLFWKRGTKEGAIAGTVAGVVVVTLGTFFVKYPLGLSALAWGLIVNTLLYTAVSLATKCPEEIADKYITRVENYISAGKDLDAIVGGTILASTFARAAGKALRRPNIMTTVTTEMTLFFVYGVSIEHPADSSVLSRPELVAEQEEFLRGLVFSARCGA